MAERQTIYVTGSTGMLGFDTLHALTSYGRWCVLGVSRKALPYPDPLENIITPQPLEAGWLPEGDQSSAIVHFAGFSDPRRQFRNYAELSNGEIVPQVNMVETILHAGWRGHLIYISSGGVYGDVERMPVGELQAPKPKGCYALYKLAVEQALVLLASQHDFRLTILRVSNPYGSRVVKKEQGVIPMLVEAARCGTPFTMIGSGSGLRDYLHVSDFTGALARVIESRAISRIETLNIGSGTGTSVSSLINLVSRLTGKSIRVSFAPGPFDVNSNILDISRAKALLNWAPEVALETGLKALIECCCNRAPN